MATQSPAVNFFAAQNPSYLAQQMQAQYQQKMADMLTQEGQSPIQYDPHGAISPWQGLAKMLQAYTGAKMSMDGIPNQAALQAQGNQMMLNAYGGGQSSPDQSQFQTGQAALTQQAQSGAQAGPTKEAAALANSLAPAQNNGQQATAANPNGLPTMLAVMAANGDPSALEQVKALMKNKELTNEQKNSRDPNIGSLVTSNLQTQNMGDIQKLQLARGLVPDGSPQAQQLDDAISKANYIAPIDAKPGTPVLDPRTLQPRFFAPKTNDGINLDFANPLQPTASAIPGYAAANAGIQGQQAQAEQSGKEGGTVRQGVDANGNPVYIQGVPQGAQGTQQSQQPTWTGTNLSQQSLQQLQAQANAGDRDASNALYAYANRANQQPQGAPVAPANPPGFAEFQTANAKSAADRYNGLISQASDSPVRVNVLDKIMGLSQQGVATGPGSDWQNNVKGMAANIPGFKDTTTAKNWQGSASDYQELTKFLNQNAMRAWQAAGGTGTDSQLEASTAANVNSKMFPQALQGVAQWAKAGEMALQGKANAAQQQGINTPQAQTQFESTWRNSFDPIIYQLKTQTPAQQQQTINGLKAAGTYNTMLQKASALKQMGGL